MINLPNLPNVAFIGPMGVGKTTCANLLVLGDTHTKLSFADSVKDDTVDMLNHIVSYSRKQLPDVKDTLHKRNDDYPLLTRSTLEEFKNPVFRPLLQWYGTDFWRQFMGVPDYWLLRFDAKIKTVQETNAIAVDDCRFPNEVQFLKERGFTIIRLLRDLPERDPSVAQHVSETALDGYEADYTLDLNGKSFEQVYIEIVDNALV